MEPVKLQPVHNGASPAEKTQSSRGLIEKVTSVARVIFEEIKPFVILGGATYLVLVGVQFVLYYPLTTIITAILARVLYKNRQPIAGFFHHYYDVARERVGQLEWFKEVKGSSVVFGKAPLEKHSVQLKKLEVTKAIVIVQPGKVDKATKAAWKKENIELFQLERKSSDVLSLAELDAIVEEMRATKAKGGKSYIYSINGGGLDSALAVVAFLIKEENLSTAQAIEKLKQVEPALAFTDAEKGRLVGYEIAYKKSG